VIETKDPHSITMVEEIFGARRRRHLFRSQRSDDLRTGPVITAYVYKDADFEKTCELIDSTTKYALTGAVCALPFAPILCLELTPAAPSFATDRSAVVLASRKLREASGNFYIGNKCTGAVVGQRASSRR
jgi:1-pyrroline-5-carboxylate dehydrogenase